MEQKKIDKAKSKKYEKIIKGKYLYWVYIYVAVVVFHLYSCYVENDYIRFPTKMLLMPLLYLSYTYNTSKEKISKTYKIALILGWLGDCFLLTSNKQSPLITMGVVSFFSGHLFFIISFMRRVGKEQFFSKIGSFIMIFSFCAVLSAFQFKVWLFAWTYEYGFHVHCVCYLGMLCAIASFAWMIFLMYLDFHSLCIGIGIIFFWFSDFNVVRVMFDKNSDGNNFLIMLTYLIAQSLICYGIHNIH